LALGTWPLALPAQPVENMKDIKIINDFYIMLKWYGNLLSKFPRNHRYALGLRIENTLYVTHELLVGLPFVGLHNIGLPKSVRQKLFNCAQ
jgi:hypothetical protein